jgi:hypothetical protein
MGLSELRQRKDVASMEERRLKMVETSFGQAQKEYAADTELREQTRQLNALKVTLGTDEVRAAKVRLADIAELKKTNPDIYTDYMTGGMVTKDLQMQLKHLGMMFQGLSAESQIFRNNVMAQEQIRKGIDTEIDAVYNSGASADDKLLLGGELKTTLTAMAQGKFDPNTMRTPGDIRMDLRDSIAKERERQLSEQVDKEKRAASTKATGTRETASLRYELDEGAYEFGSLQEVKTARANLQRPPEVRSVYYDGRGWGVATMKDKTGMKVPSGKFQVAGYKLMTRKRATELDLQDEWDNAKTGDLPIDEALRRAIEGE